ncbi:hypothetical protein BHE74_00039140 [Ensete ventricosum]|nr:hypothetical protein BHE74_00039140 [Ensete ventricosum]RZS28558.1 hypothetical protein BHM03_00062165 [Ensete ventricosum]
MLHPGVTQEWVDEGELPREQTKIGDGRGPMMFKGVLKPVVERGEEATMSPEGLSYPKSKVCKATDSRAMGLVVPWYPKGGTSVESSIPYSHGGRALVVKGAEEVVNKEANSKYQDKAEGQRPRNFIRPMLMGFSSR